MVRTISLFFATSLLGVALACPGGKCADADCGKTADAGTATTTDVTKADGTKATLTVSGMSCGSCAGKVQAKIMGVDGVKAATVDATTGKAQVAYDPAKTNLDKVIAAVATAGHFSATADAPAKVN